MGLKQGEADIPEIIACFKFVRSALLRVMNYRDHRYLCEIEQTDFCTCGSFEASKAAAEALSKIGVLIGESDE